MFNFVIVVFRIVIVVFRIVIVVLRIVIVVFRIVIVVLRFVIVVSWIRASYLWIDMFRGYSLTYEKPAIVELMFAIRKLLF